MIFDVAFARVFAIAVGLTTAACAQQPPADEPEPEHVEFIEPAKVEAALANAPEAEWVPCLKTSGVSSGPCSWFVDQPGLAVRIERRERIDPDGAEVHAAQTHVWHILDGDATFVTGGKLLGPKGALYIEGGEDRHLRKGVVIVVPPGTPHMWKEIRQTLVMYMINVVQASPEVRMAAQRERAERLRCASPTAKC